MTDDSTFFSKLHQMGFHYLLADLPFYAHVYLNGVERPRDQGKFPGQTGIPSQNIFPPYSQRH